MKQLRYYLPDTMTREHEKWIDRITDQLVRAGWKEYQIREWWQTPAYELNGYCPLEAVCNDKSDLAQMCCDKTLRMYEKLVNELKSESMANIVKDM